MTNSYWDGHGYDAEAVRFFDVAHEGAQVRALIDFVPQLHAALQGSAPRSVVIIPTDSVAAACAQYVAATQHGLPVMISNALPTFVGALDVVVVVGERAVCDRASEALVTAARRGARTALVAAGAGPLLDDAPDDCLIFPALPTAAGPSPARYISSLEVLFGAFVTTVEAGEGYLSGVAAAVDEEIAGLSPERDASVNPGRALRNFVEGARIIHTGGPEAQVIGTLWAATGFDGTVVEPELLHSVLERRTQSGKTLANGSDIFHDPFLDGPPVIGSRVIYWGGADSDTESLPDAYVVPAGIHPLEMIVRAFAATAYDYTG